MSLNVFISAFPKSCDFFFFVFFQILMGVGPEGCHLPQPLYPLSRKCLSWLLCPTSDSGSSSKPTPHPPTKNPHFFMLKGGEMRMTLQNIFLYLTFH